MRNAFNGWYVASVAAPVVDRIGKHVYQGWRPCIEWCKTQFGDRVGDRAIDGWLFVGEGVFEFRDEQDYAMFLLRWSS